MAEHVLEHIDRSFSMTRQGLRRLAIAVCVLAVAPLTNASAQLVDAFNPGASSAFSAGVFAVALQADGKILVGGDFTTLGGGGTGTTARSKIGRLNADGSLDTAFNPGANDSVLAFAVQPDGKILVGGSFTALAGVARDHIGRLNPDGSLDTAFNPTADRYSIDAIALQPNGKIVIIGSFTTLNGVSRGGIGRLNADGSLDTSFVPPNLDGSYTIALQPDGKILVGGLFTKIARLNSNGSLDMSFNLGANQAVYAFAVQPDGKILVGGLFTTLGGATRNRLGRLNADGSLDVDFNPGASGLINTVALQTDGKILVGGAFAGLGGGAGITPRNRIGRLHPDGSVDSDFDPGANAEVVAIAIQPDGKVLVSGFFTALGGGTGTTTRNHIGRLTNTDLAIQSLSLSGNGRTVTWARSGTGPEVWRVTFESSTDGFLYSSLGNGIRVAGGWQISGLSLPTNQDLFIRARGYYTTGYQARSGSIVESIRNVNAPCLTIVPTSLSPATTGVGYTATFAMPGATGAVTFALVGTLPSGISFTAGALSGTPTETGSFPLTVTATDIASGCTASQNVTLTVVLPTLAVSPTSLRFAATKNRSVGALTHVTPAQVVAVSLSGAVAWSATANQTWVQVTAGQGIGSGTFSVSIVNPGNVIGGATALSASVSVNAAAAEVSVSIPVTLTVQQTGIGAPPFGAFDTPVNEASGLIGAVAVTGWALDDVGIDHIEIWRNCVSVDVTRAACFDTPLGSSIGVFIGVAAFLPGARPDVEALFATFPQAYRAGWGYLMLTIALPHLPTGAAEGGQGTFTLSSYAFDVEGHVTRLGTKTITLNNDQATIPFGALDTPEQGATVPGPAFPYNEPAAYPVFGWAMTQVGKCIDTASTSSYRVYIDGVQQALVPNTNWFPGLNRSDLASAFPGLCNSTNALAAYYMDVRPLSNGLHTIGWDVIDDQGKVAGIGSRFFTVLK